MTSIQKLIRAQPDDEFNLEFIEDWPGGITGALRIMQIGDYYYWDSEEFIPRSFHKIASKLGIRIRAKKCKHVACYVVQRIA